MENCNSFPARFSELDTKSREKRCERRGPHPERGTCLGGSRDTGLGAQTTAGRNWQFPNRTSNKVLELQQGRLTLSSRKLAAEYLRTKIGRLVRLRSLHHRGHQKSRLHQQQHHHGCLHGPGEGEMSKIKTRVEWNFKLRFYSPDRRLWNITSSSSITLKTV